jgi:hypothetical protein
MNKLHAAFVPLLAVVALAAAPAIAQAEPYWTSNGKVIPEGQVETVHTAGTLIISVPGGTTQCKLKDQEEIVNPVGGGAGTDTMTAFTLAGCTKLPQCPGPAKTEIIANPPWVTELVSGVPIRDEIKGMELEVKCSNNTVLGNYKGALTPEVGASVLEFGAGSGQLEDITKTKTLTVSGADKMNGPMGDAKIGAEEVEHEPHWYSNGTRLAENTPEVVESSGKMTLQSGSGLVNCMLKDKEKIENPLGGSAGEDKMEAFELVKCKGKSSACPGAIITIKALGLPWNSELIAGSPITDEIEEMELEVKCGTSPLGVFEGTLTPATSTTKSRLEFSASSGELELGPEKLTITGIDKLKGPSGDTKITAEDP